MIYNKEYKIKYYHDSRTGRDPVHDYINSLNQKCRLKIYKYIEFLRFNQGYLDEPYGRHIQGKIRELRVDFARYHHRVFYFAFVNRNIILLHAFLKKSDATPDKEIGKAVSNYNDFITHYNLYEE